MNHFLKNLFLFTVCSILTILVLILLSNEFVKRNTFNNWETESNLLVIRENQQYDALFMGISHARNLSRHKNHLRIETITGKKIINIGRGGYYSGLLTQYLYLKYFYAMGNKTQKVIIVLTPILMYSYVYDDASNIFEDEPISFNFIRCYLSENNHSATRQLYYYIIDKLSPQWFLTVPATLEEKKESLDSLDRAKVEAGIQSAYLNGMENEVFENRKALVYKIIGECKKNNSQIIFIIPPALFGKWKGHETVVSFLGQLHNQDPAIAWYDFSESVLDPKLYYDHHHLNSAGVVYFTENYLKKIMK
jgi:hypothetical protein